MDILSYIGAGLLCVNIFTFLLFGVDKYMAKSHAWRVSEKALWIFSLAGGSIGGLAGMNFFRHKTQKTSFQLVMLVIVCIHILLLYGIYTLFVE